MLEKKHRLMDAKKILIALFCMAVFLGGCSNKTKEYENFMGLEDGQYFLWQNNMDGKKSLMLFNHEGERVFELDHGWVVACVDENGFLSEASGIVSEASMLVLGIGDSDYNAGIYQVKEQSWLQEPIRGQALISSYKGRFISLSLGDEQFNQSFCKLQETNFLNQLSVGKMLWCYDDEKAVLEIRDASGRVVKRLDGQRYYSAYEGGDLGNLFTDEGNHMIATEDGEKYLDAEDFVQRNPQLEFMEYMGVNIQDRPSEDTLIIQWNYWGENEAAEKIRESSSYLCDKEGRILKTDWSYNQVDYVEGDGVIDRDYLVFTEGEGGERKENYMNVATGEAVEFPQGYEKYHYEGNGYFLMERDGGYRIYDAVNKKEGSSFTLPERLWGIEVFGRDSFLLQGSDEDTLVINGETKKIAKSSMLEGVNIIKSGENRIVKLPQDKGDLPLSLVFDRDGALLQESEESVLWADNGFSLVERRGKYVFLDEGKSIMKIE